MFTRRRRANINTSNAVAWTNSYLGQSDFAERAGL
jgi:hypothetical protein